jgi:hypothetical protein
LRAEDGDQSPAHDVSKQFMLNRANEERSGAVPNHRNGITVSPEYQESSEEVQGDQAHPF